MTTSLPAIQTGKGGTFADGYPITADATGSSISFNHVCNGLRFMVNRNDIKAVSFRGNNGEKIGQNMVRILFLDCLLGWSLDLGVGFPAGSWR